MLRTPVIAAVLLGLTATAWAAEQTSSWNSEMRLTARPKLPRLPRTDDELSGNCAGLTVTIKARIERLKWLQEKAGQQQWPPPTLKGLWEMRPAGGDIAHQRERIARLKAALDAKGCRTVDVDAELRQAPVPGARAKTK